MFKLIKSFVKSIFTSDKEYNKDSMVKSFKMSFDNKDRIFKTGLRKDTPDDRDRLKVASVNLEELKASAGQDQLPKDFSLRIYAPDTGSFNQYSTSACGGFSSSALVYIVVKRMQALADKEGMVKSFSPLWIYWNARMYDSFGNVSAAIQQLPDSGTTLRSVMKALAHPGAIEESQYPFGRNLPTESPDAKARSASTFKINEYLRVPLNKGEETINLVKEILAIEKLPIELGVILYNEQMTNAKWNGYLKPVLDFNKANCIGGHAICITGYITDKRTGKCYLEFINSWGKEWGEKGYGYFPIEWLNDSRYVMDAWTLNLEYF